MQRRLFYLILCLFSHIGTVCAQEEDAWTFSVGTRVWHAKFGLDGDVLRVPFDPGPLREDSNSVRADEEPFVSVYVDAVKGDWLITAAAGFSDKYRFKNARTRDSIERKDYQVMLQHTLPNRVSLGLGVHRIENDGTTDGGRDGVPARDFSYSFTGPEVTAGYVIPVHQGESLTVGIAGSGTFGFYFEDKTTGFVSALDDAPGYSLDGGCVAVWQQVQVKFGYRYTYIDDSVFSLDRIILKPTGQLEAREQVDASETFQGFYLELSMGL